MAHLGQTEGGEHQGFPGVRVSGIAGGMGVLVGPGHQPNGKNRQHNADPHHVGSQSPGKDAFSGIIGRTLHDVGFRRFHSQGQGGDAVCDQVHPQNLQGGEGDTAQTDDGSGGNGQHFADIAAQDVFDKTANIVVHHPAFFRRRHDGSEVVIQQHHIASFFADVGAGNTHGDTDVRLFQGWGVIHPIPGHGNEFSLPLQRLHNAQFVLGGNPGVDADVGDGALQFVSIQAVQGLAGENYVSRLGDAQIFGNGLGGKLVVAGNHHGPNARPPTGRYRRSYL